MSLKHDLIHQALLGITDRDTRQGYSRSIDTFCEWLKTEGLSKRACKGRHVEILDRYSKHLQERGYSSGTVHTMLAPVCKAWHVKMERVSKPKRRASDISKRRLETANLQGRREQTKEKYARAVRLAEATGARRAELKNMTYRRLLAVDESGYRCAAIDDGKGGKDTLQRLTPEQVAVCDRFVAEALLSGVSLDRCVLTDREMRNHIDFHSIRAERARKAYGLYRDRIHSTYSGKELLTWELISRWNAFNPKDQIVERAGVLTAKGDRGRAFIATLKNADVPYVLRGDNRLRALEQGRPVQYDRLALLAVSVFELSHWRVDVTVTNYML